MFSLVVLLIDIRQLVQYNGDARKLLAKSVWEFLIISERLKFTYTLHLCYFSKGYRIGESRAIMRAKWDVIRLLYLSLRHVDVVA